MANDVYVQVPVLEGDRFRLREIEENDAEDLLKVYSDEKSVLLFNSDNCVDDFHYTSIECMRKAIDFWHREYLMKYYVRWSIVDRENQCAIGTVELFNRRAKDFFDNCGLLRLDLRSDYETETDIDDILGIIVPKTKELFDCKMIATKAIASAENRIAVLERRGFRLSEEFLMGHNGTKYGSYYVMEV